MSNAVYPKGLDAFLAADIDFLTDTIKVALLDSTYTYSAAHDFLNDITGTVDSPQALTTPTVVNGEAFADDVVFPAVPAGDTVTALVVYKDTGTSSTSPLIAFIDTKADTTPISIVTNDGNITISWPSGRVFKI